MPKSKKTANTAPAVRRTPARTTKAPAPVAVAAAPAAAVAPKSRTAPTREERHRMTAEAAYYIALRKGFDSDPRANWMDAEVEIEARLKAEGRI